MSDLQKPDIFDELLNIYNQKKNSTKTDHTAPERDIIRLPDGPVKPDLKAIEDYKRYETFLHDFMNAGEQLTNDTRLSTFEQLTQQQKSKGPQHSL